MKTPAPSDNRRVTAAIIAICWGVGSVQLAGFVVAGQLGLAGKPVVYTTVGLVVVGTAVSVRYAALESWRRVLIYGFGYGICCFGSAICVFFYLLAASAG